MTKIKLIFLIFGDLLKPKQFTDLAKLSPTSFWSKGDTIPNRKVDLKRKETCWEYSFNPIQTLFFDDVSDLFVKYFSSNLEVIVKYIEENKLETKIDIVVEIVNDDKPSLYFNKEFLDMVVRMKGEIDVDLYYTNE